MTARFRDGAFRLIAVALVLQTTGCGTIMYPERRGQRGGRIDAGVAVLDGIGLLFFILPGVVAFAVDFSDGAIYLPGGPRADGGIQRVPFDPSRDARAQVEKALRERTGRPVRLDAEGMRSFELESVDELPARFSAAARETGGPS